MLIPYQVDVPMGRWPVANWVLIGVTVILSIAVPIAFVSDAISESQFKNCKRAVTLPES